MKIQRRRLLTGLTATLGGGLLAPAFASGPAGGYPNKPIRLVTGYPPGGAIDIFARLLTSFLAERIGQAVIVDSRPGASGTIAAAQVARLPNDGYTLYLASAGDFTLAPSTMGKRLTYDPITGFTPIMLAVQVPSVLVVHPSVPVTNVQELINLAKSKPGELNYATFGNGSTSHIAAEAFNYMSGIKMQHVSYKGSAPAVTDLLAGRVQVMFDSATSATRFTKTGALRALAVSTLTRAPLLPDVPTISASGIPGYNISSWMGVVAPAGLPQPIVQLLARHMDDFMKNPEARVQMEKLGLVLEAAGPEQFKEFLQRETDRMSKLIVDARIQLD
jgi:tripartite-type tricarboxylate transporter receptor subunit TctC